MQFETVDKSAIRAGDAILYAGKIRTISHSDIKRDDFMGITILGDSFKLGAQKIQRVIFPKFYKEIQL